MMGAPFTVQTKTGPVGTPANPVRDRDAAATETIKNPLSVVTSGLVGVSPLKRELLS